EDAPETGAYAPVGAEADLSPPADTPQFGAYNVPPSGSPNSLVEESRSPFKLIAFVVLLLLGGAGIFFAIKLGGAAEETIPENTVTPEPKPEVIPAPASEQGAPADPSAAVPGTDV